MTRFKMLSLAALGMSATLVAVCGAGTIATAAPSASAAITTRQANYKKMGAAMKVLKDQISSGSVNKATAVAAARTLASTGRLQVQLFPAGSGPTAGVKTDALPAIWTNRNGFNGEMAKFIAASDKLVAAAGTGNADALGAQFKVVGGTCASCHKQFRADN